MAKYGLIGEKLGHSYSKQIHSLLSDYDYGMYELRPEEVGGFLENGGLAGMNVTMPYKKTVIPFCVSLSETAARIGSVNTLVRREDGWHGYNTDYDGFRYTVGRSGLDVSGKKAVVFGGGGVTPTVCAALRDLGAEPVTVVSRRGEDNYGNLDRHRDARVLVNATPVGMYPNNGASVARVSDFPDCEGVFDLVYNPSGTALLLEAERLGLVHENGLGMLVYQAARACELFTGSPVPASRVEEITAALRREMSNIILIGMPGCGKSAVGRRLAKKLGREFYDADEELVKDAGCGIPEIFARGGEEEFRSLETQTLARLGKLSGAVIATGGGCVTREENYDLLHQNGRLIWIKRDLDRLPSAGRPLSQRRSAQELYEARRDKYAAFADAVIESQEDINDTVKRAEEAFS